MSYLGNNVQKTSKNSNFGGAIFGGGTSRPRFYGEMDPKTFEYRRIGPDLTVTFFLLRHLWQKIVHCCEISPPNFKGLMEIKCI